MTHEIIKLQTQHFGLALMIASLQVSKVAMMQRNLLLCTAAESCRKSSHYMYR